MPGTITSLMDTDLYKIFMHSAVFLHFPEAKVTYSFTNRTPFKKLNDKAFNWLKEEIALLSDLRFTKDEIEYLQKEVPYLNKEYLKYLETFKFDPSNQIEISLDDEDNLQLKVLGYWKDVILYEIILLALISESYFKFVETNWNETGQIEQITDKVEKLITNKIPFSEFGTRRRRSFYTQDLIIKAIVDYSSTHGDSTKYFLGTSNVLFAKNYGLKPIGTIAHEWFMGVGAITQDYTNANKKALEIWIETFGKDSGLALTDTFGTDDFLKNFKHPIVDYFVGVRQDSGDPLQYVDKIHKHYEDLGLKNKVICFSDSLNVEKCVLYKSKCDDVGIGSVFGIGTNLTNDFHDLDGNKSEPLNIVIKLSSANGHPAIKISDNLGKNTGDSTTVKEVKELLGYNEKFWEQGDETHRW